MRVDTWWWGLVHSLRWPKESFCWRSPAWRDRKLLWGLTLFMLLSVTLRIRVIGNIRRRTLVLVRTRFAYHQDQHDDIQQLKDHAFHLDQIKIAMCNPE